ncbi:energy-coupling factor ABC transporter ATP-binding protein [Aminipila sp.]|uniref:energy-coupling factor ABC transporter ATP-binding protein n=1 Tax=Aminipila sp. TaxID=2060095 RepID=UPI0028A11BD0|nr:ABC transporter ATP-binding protein [Aminipila sp.]
MQNIEVNHLTFSYGRGKEVLSDISFTASGKESVGIIGANGVGKSTLLKLLVGLLVEYTGKIVVNGLEVKKENLPQIREKTGYVFQDADSQLFMSTVYEDVAFGPRNYGYSETEVQRRVTTALRMVHIEEMKDRQIYRLSGGQKKLASIATILSMEPDLILLDEPSIALDPKNRRNLIEILNSINSLKMIASHDLDMILDTCERTILIANGKIVKDGKTEEILTDKALLETKGLELPLCLSERKVRK